jgi:hypothetical protein
MSAHRVSQARRLAAYAVPLFVSTFVLAACDDDPVQVVPPVEWQAEIAGVDAHEAVEGLAVVASTATAFAAEIEIANAEEDAVFTWRVAEGTCANRGDRIGGANRYPDLEVEADGTATAEAAVTAALDEDEDYIVAVYDESGATAVLVACGPLAVEE